MLIFSHKGQFLFACVWAHVDLRILSQQFCSTWCWKLVEIMDCLRCPMCNNPVIITRWLWTCLSLSCVLWSFYHTSWLAGSLSPSPAIFFVLSFLSLSLELDNRRQFPVKNCWWDKNSDTVASQPFVVAPSTNPHGCVNWIASMCTKVQRNCPSQYYFPLNTVVWQHSGRHLI